MVHVDSGSEMQIVGLKPRAKRYPIHCQAEDGSDVQVNASHRCGCYLDRVATVSEVVADLRRSRLEQIIQTVARISAGARLNEDTGRSSRA